MDQASIQKFHNYLRLQLLLAFFGCDILRKIFRTRYKLFTDNEWVDGSDSTRRFYLQKGKTFFKTASEAQKKKLKTGDVEQWDISLLGAILLSTGFHVTVGKKTQRKIDQENENILKLIKLKNEIVTLKRQRIADVEFIYLWNSVQNVLQGLGLPSDDRMTNIITTSKFDEVEYKSSFARINEDNETMAISLEEEGIKLANSGDYKDAIGIFTKALQLVSISNVERSNILAKRSSAYLKYYELIQKSGNSIELAIEDAKLCMEVRPTWWEGYYLIGLAYLLKGERKTAFGSLNQALSLNPGYEDIIKARDRCQKVEDYDEVLPSAPTNALTPNDNTVKGDLSVAKHQQNVATWADVVLAHRYLKGDGEPQNYRKAAVLFAKAACVGNAEAAYNLGLLHIQGKGIPKNDKMAYEYFRLAVNIAKDDNLELKHIGVMESMYELGKCWETGVGTRLDYNRAAHWYAQASHEGYGEASNRLGYLYREGLGVERCPQRAIQFWSLAADQGVLAAMVTLAFEYVLMGKLDQAQLWFGRALATGGTHAKENESVFNDALEAKRELLRGGSDTEGHCAAQNSNTTAHNNSGNHFFESEGLFRYSVRGSERFWVHESQIMNCATQGCQYAQRLWKSMKSFAEGMVPLMQVLNHGTSLIIDESSPLLNEMFHHFASTIRLNDVVMSFPLHVENKFIKITEKALEATKQEKQSKLNLDVRVCYTYLLKTSPQLAMFIDEFKQKYPHEAYFHEAHSEFLASERLYKKGIRINAGALTRFPTNCNLLYDYALFSNYGINITLTDANETEVVERKMKCLETVEAYEAFLKNAPGGHKLIPESYYALSHVSILLKDIPQAVKYFRAGEIAEKNLLSCFHPYRSIKKEHCQEALIAAGKKTKTSSNLNHIAKKITMKPPEIDVDMKLQLTNPKRCAITIRHREMLKYVLDGSSKIRESTIELKPSSGSNEDTISTSKQPFSFHIQQGWKDITINDMDPTKNQSYKNCILHLVIMEDSIMENHKCVQAVVRDDSGDFQYIYFYNVPSNIPKKNFSFGSRITVFSPLFSLNVEGGPGIRIDDPKDSFFHWTGEDKRLCRFCWMENPAHTCSGCKRAQYCSRECQSRDWKLLKHKLICKPMTISETDETL